MEHDSAVSSWRDTASAECQADMDALLNAALPLAEELLSKLGEFYPYGLAMTQDGKIAMIAGYTGTEKPTSNELLDILYKGLRAKAAEHRGAAVVVDVRLRGAGTDAIQVEIEHRDGIALKVALPYRKKRFGSGLETGEMRAVAGERRIWPR
jgi:hypothetical protein